MKNPSLPITITRGTLILPALIAGLLASSDPASAGRVEPPLAVLTTNSPVNYGQPIILDGQRSRVNPSTSLVNYNWTLLSWAGNKAFPVNTSVDTTDSEFEVPISTADPLPLGSHTFQLVVTDKLGNDSAPATASVIVRDTTAPTAVLDAPATVNFGQDIVLDASRSADAGGGRVSSYRWTLVSSGTAENMFTNQEVRTDSPSFTVRMGPAGRLPLGRHDFQLVVTDDSGNTSAPATTQVIVRDTTAPTAVLDAPATVNFGQDIVLDASRSADAGGGRVSSYRWTLVSGGTAENMFTNQEVRTDSPSFTVRMGPAARLPLGRHDFQLVVTDDSGNTSAPATTQVIVRDTTAPTAVLDIPATVNFGQDFVLDASRSVDAGGGQIASYTFTLVSDAAADNMVPNQPVQTQSSSFTVKMGPGGTLPIGRHDFQLVVTDDSGNTSAPATASVAIQEFVPDLSSLKQGDKLTMDWNPAPPEFRSVEVWKSTDLNQWELETTLPGDASTHTLNTPRTGPLFVQLIFIR